MAALSLGQPRARAGEAISSPAEFIHAIHRSHRPGKRVFLANGTPQGWRHYGLTNLHEYVRADLHENEPAWYVTLHEFRNWRSNDLCSCLKNVFVDLDCHNPESPIPETAYQVALENLRAAGVPLPHIATFTGRGVQLIWSLKRVGIKSGSRSQTAVVRYQLLAKALAEIAGTQPDGNSIADTGVVDLARVIRLPGTINQHNGKTARALWVNPTELFDFHELCDAALSMPRRQVRAWRRTRTEQPELSLVSTAEARLSVPRNAPQEEAPTAPQSNETTAERLARAPGLLGNKVRCCLRGISDIERIAQACGIQGIQEGFRDQVLFSLGVFLSWTTPFSRMHTLDDVILQKALELGIAADGRTATKWAGKINGPLPLSAARSYIGTLVARAKATAASQKGYYNKEKDSRYYYKAATLWEKLGPLIERLGLAAEMQFIRAKPLPREANNVVRIHANRDRVASGRYKRHHPSPDNRYAAVARVKEGQTITSVAREIGVCRQTVANWVKAGEKDKKLEARADRTPDRGGAPGVKNRPPYICPEGAGCESNSLTEGELLPAERPPEKVVRESCKLVGQAEGGIPVGKSTGARQSCWESTSEPAKPVVQQPKAVGNDVVPSGAELGSHQEGGPGGGPYHPHPPDGQTVHRAHGGPLSKDIQIKRTLEGSITDERRTRESTSNDTGHDQGSASNDPHW